MLLLHLHPRMVPEEALQLTRTYGLGGMAVVLLALLAATGAPLLLVYEPSAERAYDSVLSLRDDTAFGGFVRNIHFWAANSLVLVAFRISCGSSTPASTHPGDSTGSSG
jgi:quinol-cytochrome oxidoreductase complex cytochrome b subunit